MVVLKCRLDPNEIESDITTVRIHNRYVPKVGAIIALGNYDYEVLDCYNVRFCKNSKGENKVVGATINLRRIGSL